MSSGPRFLDDNDGFEAAKGTPPLTHPSGVTETTPEALMDPVLLDADPASADRLSDLETASISRPPSTHGRTGLLITFGLVGLIMTWLGVSMISFVLEELRTSLVLGTIVATCFAVSLALLLLAATVELRAWRTLAKVDRLRRVLSANLASREAMLAAALDWLALVPRIQSDAPQLQIALRGAQSGGEIRALLQGRVAKPLEASAMLLGRRAAKQSAALIAISPHKGWEGVIAGGCGLLVIRQVAALYGMRPGFAVTISLLRHVAWTTVGTIGVTELSETMVSWATTDMPVVKHIAGALGGSVVDAVRIIRLSRAAARACCPVVPMT